MNNSKHSWSVEVGRLRRESPAATLGKAVFWLEASGHCILFVCCPLCSPLSDPVVWELGSAVGKEGWGPPQCQRRAGVGRRKRNGQAPPHLAKETAG